MVGMVALGGYSPAWSQGRTPDGPAARSLVERSLETLGGRERLQALHTVAVEESGYEYMLGTQTGDSIGPRLIIQETATVRRYRPDRILKRSKQRFMMRDQTFESTLWVDSAAAATRRGSEWVAGTVSDWMTAREELALAPERVLLTALAAPDLTMAPNAGGDRVVRFTWERVPVRLGLSAANGFPRWVEFTRGYPANLFWAMWGDLTFVTHWSAWALEEGGVWYPHQRMVSLNGRPFRESVVTRLGLNEDGPDDTPSIPDSTRAAFARSAGAALTASPLTPVALADGVVLFQGGYQAALVKQPDGVVILEAPESVAKSRLVLAEAARRYPGVKIKAVISTSPMWMHLAGLREYVARGVSVFAPAANGAIIRKLMQAPHRDVPDSLSAVPRALDLHPVGRPVTLGSGPAKLELYPGRGPHGAAMMLVHLPGLRLLYASDMLVPASFEPPFAAGYRAELLQTVHALHLAVDTVFGLHIVPQAMAEVERSAAESP
jgi:hypothetical protein